MPWETATCFDEAGWVALPARQAVGPKVSVVVVDTILLSQMETIGDGVGPSVSFGTVWSIRCLLNVKSEGFCGDPSTSEKGEAHSEVGHHCTHTINCCALYKVMYALICGKD